MPLETTAWDAAEYLDSPEAVAAYLDAVLEDGDPALITAALGDVARARGVLWEGLPGALADEGNPDLATLLRVLRELGLMLRVHPLGKAA